MENKNKKNIIVGLAVAAAGALLLLNNFNLLGESFVYYILSWKTLLIALGVVLIAAQRHLAGGIILTGLGLVLWLPEFFNHQFQLGQIFLPGMLVIVGIVLLFKAGGLQYNRKQNFGHAQKKKEGVIETQDQEAL